MPWNLTDAEQDALKKTADDLLAKQAVPVVSIPKPSRVVVVDAPPTDPLGVALALLRRSAVTSNASEGLHGLQLEIRAFLDSLTTTTPAQTS